MLKLKLTNMKQNVVSLKLENTNVKNLLTRWRLLWNWNEADTFNKIWRSLSYEENYRFGFRFLRLVSQTMNIHWFDFYFLRLAMPTHSSWHLMNKENFFRKHRITLRNTFLDSFDIITHNHRYNCICDQIKRQIITSHVSTLLLIAINCISSTIADHFYSVFVRFSLNTVIELRPCSLTKNGKFSNISHFKIN